jgi:hypothetical protein
VAFGALKQLNQRRLSSKIDAKTSESVLSSEKAKCDPEHG